jgi:predicted RNA-binding protein YlxR (DUF448 family)
MSLGQGEGEMAHNARGGAKPKHVPQRTCIACRQVAGKRALLRLVRGEQGVTVDPTGKQAGRGAYLHPYQSCWRAVLRGGRIEQALRTRMSEENRRDLLAFMATLPESEAADTATPDATPATHVVADRATDRDEQPG